MTTDARAMVPASASGLTSTEILAGLNAVKSVLAPDLTGEELRLFAMVANRSGLDPFAKQIYAVKRKGRVTFQTGIDGYRSIAARTGLYDGQDEPEFGPWIDKPIGHPEWATVRVYRKGVAKAIAATAYWDEYKPQDNDFMWQRMPRVMLAKVAEALALRKAFPYDPENRMGIGTDIYTADEMAQTERPAPAAPVVQPSARERIAQRAAAIVAPPDPEPEPDEPAAADEIAGEAIEVAPETPLAEHDGTPTVTVGLSVEAFREICVQAGKITQALANAIECVPADVKKRVEAMSPVERGVLADELGIQWRAA